MSLVLTNRAQQAASLNIKQPNIVLEIEGIDQLFGVSTIRKVARIGDPGLEIGDPETDPDCFYVGGLNEVEDQDDAITLDGTTTSIRQMLQIDIGEGSSISTMAIALMDGGKITEIITPGQVIDDILQAKCKVYLGFQNTAWPEDYVVIFRGVVTDVTSDSGKVVLTLNHPDDKKQGSIFKNAKPKLDGAINNSTTTIVLDNVDEMLIPVTGPDGNIDPAFEAYLRIDDEIIKYTGISSFTLTGVVRGALGSTAASHDDETECSTVYRLTDDCIDLALKILASTGDGSPYQEDVEVTSFEDVDGDIVPNAIFFEQINIVSKYNVQIGDFISTSGASNGANNVTLKEILDIIETDEGTYCVIDDVTFVTESTTSAVVSFRSKYDTLPDGLALTNDEIDFDEHVRLQEIFLGDYQYDFRLTDTIENAREFIEKEVYSPMAAFSLPRKSRCSVGYHIGPLPGQTIKIFDSTNIKDPHKMKLVRSTNKNFYNEIVYKYDKSVFTDEFLSGLITISEDSKAQIKRLNKTLFIESSGLRTDLGAAQIALIQSNRRLTRYQYGAEVLKFSVLFADGFNVEIGDIVWIDGSDLNMPDIKTALKGMSGRYFFVQNKTLSFKGDVSLECIDTQFTNNGRYGLISPSSIITAGVSLTEFTIGESYSGAYGSAERKKWTNLVGANIIIRSEDYSTVYQAVLRNADTNTIVVEAELPAIPTAGMIMELDSYDNQEFENAKLIYAHMQDNATFGDGRKQFVML